MNKQLNFLSTALVAVLLMLSLFATAVMAASGSGSGDGSNGDSGDSSTSDSSGSSDDKSVSSTDNPNDKAGIKMADDKATAEVRIKEDNNKQTAEVKVKNDDATAEIKVKSEGKTGFAGVLSRLMSFFFGKKEKAAEQPEVTSQAADETLQVTPADEAASAKPGEVQNPAPGITIDKSLSSGPGYPTGPLDISVPTTQLLLDRVGQVKGGEVKDRQYEAPLETIPPTSASIPVTINGVSYTATEIKVISNLKAKAGVGQHSGTIDIDIDVPLGSTLPAGHITLQYSGSAIVNGAMISSGGVFKTSKMTGVFAGLVSEGAYTMSIIETGSTFGSLVMVGISTTSTI